MFELRQGQSRASVSDRGAEDSEEGAQGEPTEEALEELGFGKCKNGVEMRRRCYIIQCDSYPIKPTHK